jgi:hypothetical protein
MPTPSIEVTTATKPELQEFRVWAEFGGSFRVMAADAHAANAIVERMDALEIADKIKDSLATSWPEPAQSP